MKDTFNYNSDTLRRSSEIVLPKRFIESESLKSPETQMNKVILLKNWIFRILVYPQTIIELQIPTVLI